MAFQTGSQIRPELSAVDYTPFLQASGQAAQMSVRGSESIAAGLANLGQQVGSGIKDYKQNKEKEKQYLGIIKAADTMTKGFESVLEKVDPRIAAAFSDLRSRITDPSVPNDERAFAAKSFMDFAPTLLNAGVKMLDTQSDSASKTAEINAKKAIAEKEQRIKAAGRNIAFGQPVQVQLTEDELNEATVFGADLLEKGQMTERVDELVNGKVVPTQVTTNLITRKVSKSAIREPFQSPEDIAKGESKKEYIKAGAETLKKLDSDLEQARTQTEFANQLSDAIESGATTGAFASVSGGVKNLLESILGGDYGASTQRLFEKGAKGLTMTQIRAMWKGLGTMSDTDLKEGIKTYGLINDPKKALQYYIESAKVNKDRLEERKKLSKELIRGGATQDEVVAKLDDLILSERPISEIVKEQLGLNANTDIPVNTSTQPNQPKTNFPSQEDVRAEIARRGKAGK